jgi:hypothetical protein
MSASSWVHIDVEEIIKETDGAFLILVDGCQIWLPKSTVADAGDYSEGDCDCGMSITERIAREKGLGE